MPSQKTPPKPVDASVVAAHYQSTFDLAHAAWKDRNKLFVALVLTAGLGLLLLLQVPTTDSLLVAAIAKFLNITDPATRDNLLKAFPFDILLSGVLVTMFYLMQRLYSTNLSVMRTFIYLGALEDEIRGYLGLPADSVAFTREGKFYWSKRTFTQWISKWYYVIVLFLILIPFMVLKLRADFAQAHWLITVVDLAVSLMTAFYWEEYAHSSVRLDVAELPVEKK